MDNAGKPIEVDRYDGRLWRVGDNGIGQILAFEPGGELRLIEEHQDGTKFIESADGQEFVLEGDCLVGILPNCQVEFEGLHILGAPIDDVLTRLGGRWSCELLTPATDSSGGELACFELEDRSVQVFAVGGIVTDIGFFAPGDAWDPVALGDSESGHG
ncbi:MAG TPA: hypothetical protein PKA24_20110 [Microthrixaceae bacterium]|nr:hypothetical protein [Microthrixaceae bacterium]HMT63175.1 hypothetical protein [Microthrixaceae bacterium]